MIEFNGILTGNAKKYYMKRNIKFWRKFTLLGALIVPVPLAIFSIVKHISILFYISCMVAFLCYFAPCVIKFVKGLCQKKFALTEKLYLVI